MGMVIGTNVASLTAQRHLASSRADMETSMERLSSGKRINSAMDDAAGLAITHRLDSKITGLNQGIRNANDGISMLQTAEGALEETSNILSRMKELATQASSGTYSTADRASMDLEFQALSSEITRISDTTDFNGQNLLQTAGSATFVVGDTSADAISINLQAMDATDLGLAGGGTVTQTAAAATSTENATNVLQVSTFTLASALTGTTSDTYMQMEVNGTTYTQAYDSSKSITMSLLADQISTGTDGVKASITSGTPATSTEGAADYNILTLTSEVKGQGFSSSGLVEYSATAPLIDTAATAVTVQNAVGAKKTGTFTVTALAANQHFKMEVNGTTYTQAFDTTTANSMVLLGDQITNGTDNLTAVGTSSTVLTFTSTVNGKDWTSGGLTSHSSISNAADLKTAAGAATAMEKLESAIAKVDDYRGDLGAVSNRLDHTVSNVMSRVENQSAARSRIEDTDFAVESANLAKAQVLQQAGTAMLAQANQSGQSVLSLLK
jgi:flagellin